MVAHGDGCLQNWSQCHRASVFDGGVHECNGTVQRFEPADAVTDHKGRSLVGTFSAYNIDGPGPIRYAKTPDRETGALRRIRAVAESVGATVEYQGDSRGWPITLTFADGRELCPPIRG
jgi:hypothetical protein